MRCVVWNMRVGHIRNVAGVSPDRVSRLLRLVELCYICIKANLRRNVGVVRRRQHSVRVSLWRLNPIIFSFSFHFGQSVLVNHLAGFRRNSLSVALFAHVRFQSAGFVLSFNLFLESVWGRNSLVLSLLVSIPGRISHEAWIYRWIDLIIKLGSIDWVVLRTIRKVCLVEIIFTFFHLTCLNDIVYIDWFALLFLNRLH